MTTVGSGQSQTILQGQSDSGDIVLSGGTEAVAHGGSLFDAGLVAHAQVNAGGALFDRGFADYTTVTSGGVMYIGPPSHEPDDCEFRRRSLCRGTRHGFPRDFRFRGSATHTVLVGGGSAAADRSTLIRAVPRSGRRRADRLLGRSYHATVIDSGGLELVASGGSKTTTISDCGARSMDGFCMR
jgi:hypothetical protein